MWKNIREIRLRAGLSQQKVADFCGGITRNAVSQWEKPREEGGTSPSNENFCKFMILTNSRPEELIDYSKLFDSNQNIELGSKHVSALSEVGKNTTIKTNKLAEAIAGIKTAALELGEDIEDISLARLAVDAYELYLRSGVFPDFDRSVKLAAGQQDKD